MKTVAVKPVTKSKVIKPAVMMRLLSPVRAVAMAIMGRKMTASAITNSPSPMY